MSAHPAHVAILVLAAGSSRRMQGRDKLLEEIDGIALLRHVVLRCLSCPGPVYVTLPPDRPGRDRALAGLPAVPVRVADLYEGMSASLAAGVAALPEDAAGVMVVLADMPDLTAADLASMLAAFDPSDGDLIWRGAALRPDDPAAAPIPGHPVLFHRSLFSELAALSGDQGARPLIAANRTRLRLVPLPGRHALTDLDTPHDWELWRRARAAAQFQAEAKPDGRGNGTA